jgi:pyrroloquinoline quinone biosynthesis protein B
MIECLLLGVSQDAGAPQIGCNCEHCALIKAERLPAQHAVCLAIVHRKKDVWLIDATPDVKAQWQLLETLVPGFVLRGIFLTHIHVGHYLGLASLGVVRHRSADPVGLGV